MTRARATWRARVETTGVGERVGESREGNATTNADRERPISRDRFSSAWLFPFFFSFSFQPRGIEPPAVSVTSPPVRLRHTHTHTHAAYDSVNFASAAFFLFRSLRAVTNRIASARTKIQLL